ncbi:S8 family serine peptidase [Nonomuraea sp. 3-1Str]|uniref:S8 family serine peptidase n=1 Tax=Nonomuraea sp. 3-1Str TaxID=2929801 RepID=UPI00285EF5A2|nr:S8 family serine peptidase [Nonomuraea sp. 3-1Str]MDR8414284.1 S8 family serine peptidase [Nonomuraea sp. 3-1Str]
MKIITLAVGALMAASLLAPAPAAAAAPADPRPLGGEVLAAYAAKDRTDLWVLLSDKADTKSAERARTRTARGEQVVRALRDTADRSQAPLRKLLKAESRKSETFWAANAVYVRDVPLKLAEKLAKMDGVSEVRAPKTYPVALPVETKAAAATAAAVAWGIADIKADQVWQQYGVRGEDIVVANVDTGVEYTHPALIGSYRGNNGDGTFTHDYNWYDAAGNCDEPGPCDGHNHGSHTMGTMVGDDGKGDQIGVAPKAKWIAASGCQAGGCSDLDLMRASQWMLAPTDAAGQNPDPAKRPHIVNNSWGSGLPSNEPMFEEVQAAWAASGIFGMWANGNEGPECRTSGTPGSRTLNYSVGAYDSNNKIASFSSRGDGQDGQIKPDISAPGVDVRSSVKGGGYLLMSGTSMATPHASGAVALLWSANPSLARDIEGTRTLLDLTAIDTADPQCGGDAANNNVYGEGRLDALALVQAGAQGLGTLSGTVTDAATGEPLKDATVSLSGQLNRQSTSGEDGAYTFKLLAGDYQLKVSAYGYQDATVAVKVTKDGSIKQDVPLTPTQRKTLSGTLTDGSGHGWPLGAKVTADDGKGHTWDATADAITGRFSLSLLPATDYTLRITPGAPGYDPVSRKVSLGAEDQTVDAALPAALACVAPGYQASRAGTPEPFSSGKPTGWQVTNVDPGFPGFDYQPGWVFDNPGARENRTGGSGRFAIVDSDHSGKGHVQDTYLTSPVLNLAKHTSPVLEFAGDLKPGVNAIAWADLSLDGGRTWTTVWTRKGFPGASGPAAQVVAMPQAAGKTKAQVRFHYRGNRSGWWAIDDVYVGDRTCQKVEGGLVTGTVTDAATGKPVQGAAVASGGRTATTDVSGAYWLFSPQTGDREVTVTKSGYAATTATAAVATDRITGLDVKLASS